MESPAAYEDSPMEQDEVAYPCKGCGEVRLICSTLMTRAQLVADRGSLMHTHTDTRGGKSFRTGYDCS